jgi:hypothetical protein
VDSLLPDTYVGRDGPLDKFKIDGTMTFEPGAADQAVPIRFKLLGSLKSKEVNGTLWFDRRRGRLDHLEVNVKFEGELDMAGQFAQTQKTTIRVADWADRY